MKNTQKSKKMEGECFITTSDGGETFSIDFPDLQTCSGCRGMILNVAEDAIKINDKYYCCEYCHDGI